MNFEKIIISLLILSTLLMTLTCRAVVGSTPEERPPVYSMEFLGLEVNIKAPYQVDPSENITVIAKAEAKADIEVEYIYLDIYGLKNETEEISLLTITLVERSNLNNGASYEIERNVTVPNEISPGLTYGILRWKWKYMGMGVEPPSAGFILTYVRNLEFEQLQADYNELMTKYTELDSKYAGELGGARNLMYVFVATTIVALATVLFLIIRRPKTFWS